MMDSLEDKKKLSLEEDPCQAFLPMIPFPEHAYKYKSVVYYYYKKNKKLLLEEQGREDKTKPHPKYYEETFYFNIPDILTDEYFHRHELTLHDYERILTGIKKMPFLWALAIFKKLDVTPTSVNSCFVRNASTNLGGGKAVITNLIKEMGAQLAEMKLENGYVFNKLICPHDEHVPPYPVHFVRQDVLQTFPEPARSYPAIWIFQRNPSVPPNLLCSS